MNQISMRVARLFTIIGLAMCVLVTQASAQVVTGTLRGTVRSADDGQPMIEAEVTLIHMPSGNVKTATTNADGVFVFTGLRVGGPYHVKAEPMGFKAAEADDIFLQAGKTKDLTLDVRLQEEVIEVTGTSIPRTSSGRTTVGSAEIDQLPSVTRDPRDFIRRTPEVSVEGRDRTLSVQGQNNRFNSITIDGIRQDDDFGLNASGYPTRRSPIALSAVEELAIESSPFDVRYGKFLGGNVNVVTKSGTNQLKGQLIASYAGDSLIGDQTRKDKVNVDFSEIRYGATLGGPIVKDKVHFLASVEGLGASSPVDAGPAGSGATNITTKILQEDLDRVIAASRSVYNFDPGVSARNLDESDLKILGKVDWAIDKRHRASATYQRTAGTSISNTFSSDTTLALSSNWYDQGDTMHAFSGRLLSDWSDQLSTEIELGGKLVKSRPDPLNGNGFMQATIRVPHTGPGEDPTIGQGTILLGPDQFRHQNKLDDNLLHAKAQANYVMGQHIFTGGLEYERLDVFNLFVPTSNGAVEYSSIADFEAMKPRSISYSNSVTGNPDDAAADWTVGTAVAYLQDQWKLTGDLALTGGLRFEVYQASGSIQENPNFVERYGFSNTESISGKNVLMPRLGLSYLPFDQLNVRAGAGLYSGGTPGVWVSNAYTNNGVGISNAFSMDQAIIGGFNGRDIPQALKDMVVPGNGNVDAIDPDFEIPSMWKVGAGADYAFFPGAELKLNYTFSRTQNGILWKDLRRDLALLPNNVPVGETVDGRPLYDTDPMGGQFNQRRGFDMLLTNTHKGYGHTASVMLSKGWPFGLFISGSYAWQHVLEVSPATSSRSQSNYGQAAVIDPQHPELGVSNYERAHRFTAAVEFGRTLIGDLTDSKPWKNMKTAVGLFVESRSGQPFSWTFGDIPGGGDNLARIFGEEREFAQRNRQLFYVPKGDDSDVILMGIDQGDFDNFLKKTGLDRYRGKIVPKNVFHSPWFTKFDMRIAQDLPNPVSGHRARFVLDIENLGNLMNDKWGRVTSVPFPYTSPAVDVNIDRATGKYIYSNLRVPDPSRVDVLQSVWRMSLGLMYDF